MRFQLTPIANLLLLLLLLLLLFLLCSLFYYCCCGTWQPCHISWPKSDTNCKVCVFFIALSTVNTCVYNSSSKIMCYIWIYNSVASFFIPLPRKYTHSDCANNTVIIKICDSHARQVPNCFNTCWN